MRRLTIAAAWAVLACALLSDVALPVRLTGTCEGHDCVLWAHGRGLQEWRWYWEYTLDGLEVKRIEGVTVPSQDSAGRVFHFQNAKKVPYLFVVTINGFADSLRLDAAADGTVVR